MRSNAWDLVYALHTRPFGAHELYQPLAMETATATTTAPQLTPFQGPAKVNLVFESRVARQVEVMWLNTRSLQELPQ